MSDYDEYDLGYHDAYEEQRAEIEKLEQQNEAMRALIAANYRGMREEIIKELENDTHTN